MFFILHNVSVIISITKYSMVHVVMLVRAIIREIPNFWKYPNSYDVNSFKSHIKWETHLWIDLGLKKCISGYSKLFYVQKPKMPKLHITA